MKKDNIRKRVKGQKKDSSSGVASRTSKNELSDDIGFLLIDLSINDTVKVQWNKLPKKIQKLFLKVINSGIDKEEAEIRQRKNLLFTLSYADADADFSAVYIIYQDRVVFIFEN